MVAAAGDRIDGWWSRKATIADSRRARVLVFMQSVGFQIERNGARKKPRASTLKYALDNAVVVIEGMTNKWEIVLVMAGGSSSQAPAVRITDSPLPLM